MTREKGGLADATAFRQSVCQRVDVGPGVVEMTRSPQIALAMALGDEDLDSMSIPQPLLQWMNGIRW